MSRYIRDFATTFEMRMIIATNITIFETSYEKAKQKFPPPTVIKKFYQYTSYENQLERSLLKVFLNFK